MILSFRFAKGNYPLNAEEHLSRRRIEIIIKFNFNISIMTRENLTN